MSIEHLREQSDRRKRLHDLVDLREELRELKTTLESEENRFIDATHKRNEIMSKNEKDDSDNDNEDHFLENLRISEENIHSHRQKIIDIEARIIDIKESILSLEILIKLHEEKEQTDCENNH